MKINDIGSTVLILSALTEVFSQKNCYQGFTGGDSGGSCSFSQSLCDWSIQSNGSQGWKLNPHSFHIQFNTFFKEGEESSVLISPLMCEMPNTNMSLKFRVKIESNEQRNLTLNLKCQESNCNNSLIWSSNTSRRGIWEEDCVDFQFPKTFKIVFEAKKQKGVSGTDADFSIDNITYNNKCCSCTDIPTVKTENIPATSSSYFTSMRHSATTGESSTVTKKMPNTIHSTSAPGISVSAESSTFTSNLSSATHSTSAPGTPLSDTNGESSTVTSNLPSTAHPTNAPGTAVAEVNTTHGKTTTTFYNTSTFMTTSVTNVAEKGVDHTLGIVLGSIALGLGAAVLIIVIVFRLRRKPGTHNPDNQSAGTTIMIMNEIYVSA